MKTQKIITDHPYVVIIILFLFSVLVRLPNLNRPLSKHHEFCTATCLRTMQIWADVGAATYHFNPIMTYPGFANKFINNQTLHDFNKNGDSYYESYPPGGYLLPFFIFEILHIYPDVLPLQIYNLLLHLIECVFLFKIVMLFAGKQNRKEFQIIGFLAVVFQLFNPCTLWFHGNVYMTDMQGSAFFVISVFLLLKIILEDKFLSPKWLILLGLSNFTMCYSEYIGVTFSAIAGLYCLIKGFKKKQYIFPLIVTSLTCFAALSITIYQYSLINGFNQLTDFIAYRYSHQSGYGRGRSFLGLLDGIFLNYVIGLLPELFLIGSCILVLVVKKSLSVFLSKVKKYSLLIIFIYLPVVLHHLIFLNASQYDFHVLKATPAISLLCAALVFFIYRNNFFVFLQEYRKPVFVLIIGVVTSLSIVWYYTINMPGKISVKGMPYEREKVAGNYIRQNSSPDEVIFIKGFEDEPQIVLYAHRNMRTIIASADAVDFLRKYHRSKGVIFTLDSRGFVTTEKHISI